MATLSTEKQTEVIELYQAGSSMQQIADRYSITIGAVLYALRKHNIKRRSSKESNSLRIALKIKILMRFLNSGAICLLFQDHNLLSRILRRLHFQEFAAAECRTGLYMYDIVIKNYYD